MAKVQARSLEKYQILLTTGEHALVADEPAGVGDGIGPDPYELLLSALGACTTMTVQMYARRKGWQVDDVRSELSFARIHASDCEDCEQTEGYVERIQVHVHVEGDLDEAQKDRLREIATRCPVRKSLLNGLKVVEG